jgi:Pyrimidine reductase, riboflavin biosynthesis
MAQSLNGYISGPSGRRVVISSPEDMERVMALRDSCDGILVGMNTVKNDDPVLSTHRNERSARIVIDPEAGLNSRYRIMDDARKTFILNTKRTGIQGKNTEYLGCGDPFELGVAMDQLKAKGINRLLVEGGEFTAMRMLEAQFVDEFYLFVGDVILPDGGRRTPSSIREIRNVILYVSMMKGGILLKIDPHNFRGKVDEE